MYFQIMVYQHTYFIILFLTHNNKYIDNEIKNN